MNQRTHCPQCQSAIEGNPALFTFKTISCEQCQTPLRTSLNARLLHILSFGILTLYYLAVSKGLVPAQNQILFFGLLIVCLPLVVAIFLPRYERGDQRAPYSSFVNTVFYTTVIALAAIWLLR